MSKKVALVHDWTIHMRGGEKVLDALAEIYPDAKLYTLFYDPEKLSERLKRLPVKTSFLNVLPGIKKYYRWLLPFMPLAIRLLKVDRDTELIISSSHCVAKAVRKPNPSVPHICYCHSPMRYLWGFQDVYFKSYIPPIRWLIHQISERLRKWDIAVNSGVDLFIGNSNYIRERIKRVYDRDAEVVYPPLEENIFVADESISREGFYLAMSHFVPYKRIDIVIEAFNELKLPLKIVGSGPLEEEYKRLNMSANTYFEGSVSDEKLQLLMNQSKALIFPAEEDFGIIPLEVQACGTPVIAYGKGGALETVKTGEFFNAQTPKAIADCIRMYEKQDLGLSKAEIRSKILSFGRGCFKQNLRNTVDSFLQSKTDDSQLNTRDYI